MLDGLPLLRKELGPGYRAHGSLHESAVPLVVYNAEGAPPPEHFQVNLDLTRWLYR